MRAATLAITAFATGALAGNALLRNMCEEDVYLWTVGEDGATARGKFASGKTWTEPYADGVRELKVSTANDALETVSTLTGLVYGVSDGLVAYDLYTVFGSPFDSIKVTTNSAEGDCPDIEVKEGEALDPQRQPAACSAEADVGLVLCGYS